MPSEQITLDEPWWCMEGYVAGPDTYTVLGHTADGEVIIRTSKGQGTLLEPYVERTA